MKKYKAGLAVKMENELGECPMWHPDTSQLYWVDILKGYLYYYNPVKGSVGSFQTGKYISALVPTSDGKLVAALQNEIVKVDIIKGNTNKLMDIEGSLELNRCNDGKCDTRGRFWIGTMHIEALPNYGALYRINHDLSLEKMLAHLTISNGMGWSPDDREMYFIDSFDHCIRSFDFEPARGAISNEKTCILVKDTQAMPDGMCVDAEGNLWIAFWGGGRVGGYDPRTGEHIANIEVAAQNVTSCCFGGADGQTLFITTARAGLSNKEVEQNPLSGSLFSCRMPVKGLKTNCFKNSFIV